MECHHMKEQVFKTFFNMEGLWGVKPCAVSPFIKKEKFQI